jgi:hypothetical protein
MRRRTIVSSGLLVAAILAGGRAGAVQFVAQANIPVQPINNITNYRFVAASGDTVLTAFSSNGLTFQGIIDVRTGTTWSLQRVVPDGTDTVIPTRTIVGLAVSGDTAVFSSGAVYVYTRSGTTWSLQQQIMPPSSLSPVSVALAGDVLAVGLESGADPTADEIAVYTRSGTTWTQQQLLPPPPSGSIDAAYGGGLALSGNTLVSRGSNGGYVFVQGPTGWTLQQTILAPATGFAAIALDGDTLAIGGVNGAGLGTATVYVRSGGVWSQQQILTASDGFSNDGFGSSIALAGDTLATVGHEGSNSSSGSVYLFSRSGGLWSQAQEISSAGTSAFLPLRIAMTSALTLVVSISGGAPWVFVPATPPSVPALGGGLVATALLVLALCACAWMLLARARRGAARPPTST